MTSDALPFVSIERRDTGYIASLSLEGLLSLPMDVERLLRRAAASYGESTTVMRSLVSHIEDDRSNRKPISARRIWELGDIIFTLIATLEKLSLQLDGVYAHLTRDLGVRRMWLEKVIIFRRYVPRKDLIPENLRWGRCARTPRRVAQLLLEGKTPT